MKAKRPPAPPGERQAVPDHSIGDASSAGGLPNINETKSASGRIIHKRVGGDRRHRQKAISLRRQKQSFAFVCERSRHPGRLEFGGPSVAGTHGFRHELVEAGRQFWFAPSGHLKTDFPFAHRGAPSHGRTGLTIAVAGRRASRSSPESSGAEIKNSAHRFRAGKSRGFERRRGGSQLCPSSLTPQLENDRATAIAPLRRCRAHRRNTFRSCRIWCASRRTTL